MFTASDWISYSVQLLVIIGVAGETYAHCISGAILPFLSNPRRWKRRLEKAFAGVLVLALIGELVSSMNRDAGTNKLIGIYNNNFLALKLQLSPRADLLKEDQFLTWLQKIPFKGKVMLEYEPNDPESYDFARRLQVLLAKAGWGANKPIPLEIPEKTGDIQIDGLPLQVRAGYHASLVLRSMQANLPNIVPQLSTSHFKGSLSALQDALSAAGVPPGFIDGSSAFPSDYVEVLIWKKS